jgi:hypothetical protein
MPDVERQLFFRALGLHAKATRKSALLVRHQLHRLRDEVAHGLATSFAASALNALADLVSDAGDEANLATELGTGPLGQLATTWPLGVIRLALEVLWNAGQLTADERDELIAGLDGPGAALPGSLPTVTAGLTELSGPVSDWLAARCGDARRRERLTKAVGRVGSDPIDRLSPLDAMIGRAVTAAGLTGSDGESSSELVLAREALEELIRLDVSRPLSWRYYGHVLERLGVARSQGLQPLDEECQLQLLLGRVQALAASGPSERFDALVRAEPDRIERLLGRAEAASVAAAVLGAHFEERRFVHLLGLIPTACAGWDRMLANVSRGVEALLEQGQPGVAEVRLRAVQEALLRWTREANDDAIEAGLERHAAAVALLRAECRRRRGEFAGASRILETIDAGFLDAEGLAARAREAGLAAAQIKGLNTVRVPKAVAERVQLAERLTRARHHLEAALDADPGQLVATVLLGLLACCVGDDPSAVAHLDGVALDETNESPLAPLATPLRFHRALAKLRLLEPGTDEGAYQEMAAALFSGYAPSGDDLVSGAVALGTHGSPHTGAFVALAAGDAPDLPTLRKLADLVMALARQGDAQAAEAAEVLVADGRLSRPMRYELAEAALANADLRGDMPATERLVAIADDVLVRASSPELEGRFAELLAVNDTLRDLLDPAQADALRVDVLRRIGRVDEALAIAASLFHRAASGATPGLDPADLLELVTELGAPPEDVARLSRLLPRPAVAGEPNAPRGRQVRVVFVGGDETQQRYVEQIDAMFAARYGGAAEVLWFLSGWTSNWAAYAERIAEAYTVADAVVVMTFVRTNLGRWVRRTAGEAGLPWLACTGHGRASIERAIERAVRLVAQQTAASP